MISDMDWTAIPKTDRELILRMKKEIDAKQAQLKAVKDNVYIQGLMDRERADIRLEGATALFLKTCVDMRIAPSLVLQPNTGNRAVQVRAKFYGRLYVYLSEQFIMNVKLHSTHKAPSRYTVADFVGVGQGQTVARAVSAYYKTPEYKKHKLQRTAALIYKAV